MGANAKSARIEALPAGPALLTAAAAQTAVPSLFFDQAPVFAHAAGVVSITLSVTRHGLNEAGEVVAERDAVAILRCSIPAARELKVAIERALLLAEPTGGASN